MTVVNILLVLSSINLLLSFINFFFYASSRKSKQEEEVDDEKEELLVERDLNSRLRYLQTARFGPPMFSQARDNSLTRKIRNDDEKR